MKQISLPSGRLEPFSSSALLFLLRLRIFLYIVVSALFVFLVVERIHVVKNLWADVCSEHLDVYFVYGIMHWKRWCEENMCTFVCQSLSAVNNKRLLERELLRGGSYFLVADAFLASRGKGVVFSPSPNTPERLNRVQIKVTYYSIFLRVLAWTVTKTAACVSGFSLYQEESQVQLLPCRASKARLPRVSRLGKLVLEF
jgi:hypothetical protein